MFIWWATALAGFLIFAFDAEVATGFAGWACVVAFHFAL